MKLFFYVFRLFLKFTAGVTFLAVFMFVLSDLVDKYGRMFDRYDATANDIFYYYIFQIPFQLIQILPFAALIGSIGTMIMLNRSGEVIAVRAAGVGPFGLFRPFLAGGVLFLTFTFLINQLVIPTFAIKRNRLVERLKGGGDQTLSESRWTIRNGWVYTFSDYDLQTKTLVGVRAFKLGNDKSSLAAVWKADRVAFDQNSQQWKAIEMATVRFLAKSTVTSNIVKEQMVSLPFEPKNLFNDDREPIEFSYSELWTKIDAMRNTGSQYRNYQTSFHVKVGYCFASILLSVLGLKFGFIFERSSVVMKNLIIALTLGVSYWFVLSSARAFVLSSSAPTWIAGWAANIFFLLVVFYEVKKLGRI